MFPYKCYNDLFQFCEKCQKYFDRGCTKTVDCLGQYGNFNDVNFSNPQNKTDLSICSCCLQFLSTMSYNFSESRSFTSLVRFIPRYFILFDTNGILKKKLSFGEFVVGIQNHNGFLYIILHPATLLNSCISYKSFLWVSLGLSTYSIMASANSNNFTSSFPIWIPVISFLSLTDVARTANIMLNKGGESDRAFLFCA